MIYLDSAATTFVKPPSVKKWVDWALDSLSSPGRGGYEYAMRAAKTAFACRESAAKLFGVTNPENVVFTFNATHALNIAIMSAVKPGERVVVSGYEHNSVVRPLTALGCDIRIAEFEPFDDAAAIEAFRRRLSERPSAAVINHVSNVTGYILPMDEIAALCRDNGVRLIVDASQSAGCVDLTPERWGAGFTAMPGHKGLYGPQGTGLLLCAAETTPVLHGGTGSDSASAEMPAFLPDRLEAGTHNMPGIAGLLAGIRYVQKTGTARILSHEQSLVRLMADGLGSIAGVRVYRAENKQRQAGVLSFNIDGISSEEAGEMFAKRNIALRAGLHCSPMAHRSLGTFPQGTVRASVSAFTTKNDVNALLNAAESIVKRRRVYGK